MSGKLYIHVGAGKTGTSAIQEFLFLNRDAVDELGVKLFPHGLIERRKMLAHHGLADHTVKVEGDVFSLWEKVNQEYDKDLLVTSELFHSKMQAGGGGDYFKKIRSIVDKEIKIVFYIRRHSQWLQSAYSQWVKGRERLGLEFKDFLKQYPKNTAQQVIDFGKCFGNENVIVRPYVRDRFVGGSIYSDFLNCLGVGFREDFTIPNGNVNPRLSLDSLELKRLANLNIDNGRVVDFIGGRLSDYSKSSASSESGFDHDLIDPEAQVEIEKENEHLYSYICRNIVGDESGDLFKDGYYERMNEKMAGDEKGVVSSSADGALSYLVLKLYEDMYLEKNR